ncbi:SPOR domain-containing protein [Tateyamaria pelophila]|uniref:SPOR domain-containing protein n=1 Tax=Tateyamaria pelophila TaxID=328415 RepID=UPI001CBF9B7D|nr:SPOR domain-containing protein [Tateyamaria pelophila]
MKLAKIAALSLILLSIGTMPSVAQDQRSVQAPANLPPASFTGTQFVDSNGCMFSRANIDGTVTWVPRVNSRRQLVCGQPPTLVAKSNPVEATSSAQRTTADTPTAPTPGSPRTASTRQAADPVVVPTTRKAAAAPGAPADASQTAITGHTRVLPKHLYENRPREKTIIPKGYRPAWDDDRLNPRRAEQTLEGIARTRMLWTNTVPRRLIDQSTGRDVTTTVPLFYPYTDIDTQQRELGRATIVLRNGQVQKRVLRTKNPDARPPAVLTHSAPATTPEAARLEHFVQVGVYGISANADAAAQKLAGAGLPARRGTLKRGGTSYKLVMAGPFATAADAQRALGKVRAAGFSDAYLRKLR